MNEYEKKFATSKVLVIKHVPPVQFKTKKTKAQINNDFGKMTLDEAIQHCYDVVNTNKVCGECAKEHLQLAKWLEELKRYRKSSNTKKIKTQTNNDFGEMTLDEAIQYC